MRPQDTAYIIERLAVRFMAMVADHERQLAEHRASFGARTEADAKIIAGLQEKVYLSEGECNVLRPLVVAAAKYKAERDDLYQREGIEKKRRMDVESERDGLQTQVQDMRAEMERLQMEVAALKSQTPKQTLCDHPVTVKREPEVGDTVQLVKRPTKQDYELSWLDDWGKVGESFRAVSGVCTYNKTPSVLVEIRGENYSWPLSCVEVVTEATHDTEAGKAAAAEAAVKTEPVADEIKAGDLVEVYQATAVCTRQDDIGSRGIVEFADECVSLTPVDGFKAAQENHVGLCDVRKVTT